MRPYCRPTITRIVRQKQTVEEALRGDRTNVLQASPPVPTLVPSSAMRVQEQEEAAIDV